MEKKLNVTPNQKEYNTIKMHMNLLGFTESFIQDSWRDEQGFLCVKYKNGQWWHYSEQGEWW